ncbi:hypothetical protein KIN20_009507 [Parelaphostrongylus tenuis]|uniref:Uncharacterized protein n=1 Tax=Parelaphostrongylus tenuis TaxID=148309 RepID=A0AAD5MP48_PARTN|nr:hypothetical protein KIN20_009507 [Parelaphostrongylus tenuis]
MRLLIMYFITWLITIGATRFVEHRSLIPWTLRRNLCEKTRRADICDSDKMFRPKQTDDGSYSIWSFCKHSPELLFCKWNPSRNVLIPVILNESTTVSSRIRESTTNDPPEQNPPLFSTSNSNELLSSKLVRHQQIEDLKSAKEITTEKMQVRSDGKLNDDRQITENTEESMEEEFNENIMMVQGNLFG